MTRRWRSLAVAVALVAAAGIVYRALGDRDREVQRWRTEKVTRGDLVASITATGTVNPVTTVQVGTYVSGPIQAIDVDFNSLVARGQRVAKIDPRPFQLRVQQAEAELANARAALAKARADRAYKTANLARNRALAAQGIVAADAVDVLASGVAQAHADVALQEAQTRQAEAKLEEARVNLGYTDIVSPVDGVVVSRNVDVGQTVAASFQTPTLFVIAEDLTKMQVNANVSEADIGTVRAGQTATFTVDAYPERAFTGVVSQVRNSPLNVQNVITYDVVIDAGNADLALRPGMTANVDIVTGRRENVLRVPTAALRFRPPAGEGEAAAAPAGTAIWRLAGGAPEPVVVAPGLSDDSYTEVHGDALREGDPVVVGVERRTEASAQTTQRPPGFNMGGGGRRR
ncbi:MAG: efflux RND transporter periplasmic adaptor subunit [Deltaproteobacteria bacterium]|nr:efflux RND transporter periplasmic adaptor subunit [Deltaproteobacteria bacterium]